MGKVHNPGRNANPDFGGQSSTPFVRALGYTWVSDSASQLRNLSDGTAVFGFKRLTMKLG